MKKTINVFLFLRKKNAKESNFLKFGFTMKNMKKKKLNIIKISKKLMYFKII